MKKFVAEAVGTFGLVFCGTGAVVMNAASGGAVTHVGIAITFGFIVMAMIFAFGEISGTHINPAVTLTLAIGKHLSWREVPNYLSAQFVGAMTASTCLWVMFPEDTTSLGATLPAGSEAQSFILEMILTFLLMLVILGFVRGKQDKTAWAPFAIGGVVLLEAMFAGPICGASMNPIRSISPALVSGNLTSLWIYLFAPTFGAILALPVSQLLYGQSTLSTITHESKQLATKA